jgi:hypothetical protein
MSEQGGSGWQTGPSADGRSGCVKLLFVVVVVIVVAVVGLAVVAGNFLGSLGSGGGNGGDALVGGDCPYLSDAEAATVLGGNPDALALEGLYDMSIGLIVDKRVLAEAPDCFVSDGGAASLARVAVLDGGDAAAVFATERDRAAPSSQDQGGGVSVENAGYFGGEVSGIGDEAFCTGLSDAIMAGVLVRQGDRLVYVSVGAPSEGQEVPDMETTPDGVVVSPGLCALAQDLARAVLD